MTGFLGELKRRNVFKVAAAYAVGGWLLTEVISVMLPAFGAPGWVLKVVIALMLLGFPIALTLSWVYEITSEGVKRESDVDRSDSITQVTGQRLNMLTIALIVIAIGFVVFERFIWTPDVAVEGTTQVDSDAEAAEATGAQLDTAFVIARSVAVLPFVNISDDPSNEYFSDGVSEEILNELVRIPGLKVASRTSSFQFKGDKRDISDIGNQLNVANVLEGSVRKAGNRVRITAQLISVDDGFHLWSDTYDRELTDIFAIQDEIAVAIADALRVSLNISNAGASASVPTTDMRAYDLYLLGLHHWNLRGYENLFKAMKYLEQSVEIDPEFARAWLGLGLVYSVISDWGGEYPGEKAAGQALEAAGKALELDPELGEAHAVRASALDSLYRWDEAMVEYQSAIRLKPDFATAHQWYGSSLVTLGKAEEGLDSLSSAYELDPDSRIIASNFASMFLFVGQYDKALEITTALVIKYPDYFDGWAQHFYALYHLGRYEETNEAGKHWAITAQKPRESIDILFAALTGADITSEQREKLKHYDPGKSGVAGDVNALNYFDLIVALTLVGEIDTALDRIETDVAGHQGGMVWVMIYPAVSVLWCEPRFTAALARMNLPPSRSAEECAAHHKQSQN